MSYNFSSHFYESDDVRDLDGNNESPEIFILSLFTLLLVSSVHFATIMFRPVHRKWMSFVLSRKNATDSIFGQNLRTKGEIYKKIP
jgi:hypothetical protein